MHPVPRPFAFAALVLIICTSLARADEPPAPVPEPTPNTAKGALKLFCHRLGAGDFDKALELCPADTSEDDKTLMKDAVECYKAFEELRKVASEKYGADAVAQDKYSLTGPRLPTDAYIDSAKEAPSSDDPNKVELRGSSTMPGLVAIKDGDIWRVLPADLLRVSSFNRSDPADCFHAFADYAKQATKDVVEGKYAELKDLTKDMSRRRSEYSRAQYDKRRKGGL